MSTPNWDDLSPTPPQSAPAPVTGSEQAPEWDSLQTSEQRFGTPTEIAKTAIEQGLSGVTLGLSKVAETKFLGVKPAAIKGREEENPVTSTLANIGGTGAIIYGTGGLGGLAEGAGAATKIGAAALEGGVIGGVNEATDQWAQENPQLNAEKIVASASLGALFGGVTSGLLEGVKGTASGISKASDWFSKYMDSATEGTGVVSKIAEGYQAAGEKSENLIKDLTDNFGELYKGSKEAVDQMYKKAGDFHLNNALEDMPIENAKRLADETLGKVQGLVGDIERDSNFDSRATAKLTNEKIGELKTNLSTAETSRDVHDALTGFATDLDKGIKFDKVPTAAQQYDQEVLRNVREAVRGDLKNSDLWGKAAPVYEKLSRNYSEYQIARRNFEKDFMKPRIGPNGNTIRVIDPSKIKSFFDNINDPRQALRMKSFEDFTWTAMRNAHYGENYGTAQSGMDELFGQIADMFNKAAETNKKVQILKTLEEAKKGHTAGIGSLIVTELLPPEYSAPFLAIKRYAGSGGLNVAGSDLFKGVQLAKSLAKHAEKVTVKIDKGARAIFSGSSSQARKNQD